MKRLKIVAALLPLLLAAPAFAGVVYVPFASDFELGGVQYRTWIWVSNNHPDIAGVAEHYLIKTFEDGTVRADEPTAVWTAPGQTRVFAAPEGQGMLEIFASPDVFIQARLVPEGTAPAAGEGIAVPIISSEDVVPAGQTVQLLGWVREGDGKEAYSNLGILNLGHRPTQCLASVYRGDGMAIIEDVPLDFAALSHNHFQQVMRILGETEVANWRLTMSCNEPFYSYLSIYHPESGHVAFFDGAKSGLSELVRPGAGPSTEFVYASDLPFARWGGIKAGPFKDKAGADFHAPGGPRTGFKKISFNNVVYDKGISWYPQWGKVPHVEIELEGQYALFTADVRVDDQFRGSYEWAIVNPQTGQFIDLVRPPDGYRGRETINPIRLGSACTFQILGDGEVLYSSPEVYAYGDPIRVEVDVTGVNVLRLQIHPDGTEQLNAPHRRGLSRARLVKRASWFDMIAFGDAKLFYPAQ